MSDAAPPEHVGAVVETQPTPTGHRRRRPVLVVAAAVVALGCVVATIIAITGGAPSSRRPVSPAQAPTSSVLSSPSTSTSQQPPGLLGGVGLKRVGGRTVRSSNLTLQNLQIDGDLVIDAPAADVTVVNVAVSGAIVINGDTPKATVHGKKVGIVPHNIVLRHVDAHRFEAVGFDGLTVEDSRFHDNAGTISQLARYSDRGFEWPATNLQITRSVFQGLGPLPADSQSHVEALHLMGVQGFTLSDDLFDATAPDQNTWKHITAALTLESAFEGVPNSGSIVGCRFVGGSYYQAYLWGATRVDDNAFTTATSPDGLHRSAPMYPPAAYAPAKFPAFEQQGNTLDGRPYTLPQS